MMIPLCCINIDVSIGITVKSQDSTDLLDPNNPNSYDFQRMRLFYRIGSRKVTAYRSLYPPESVMGSGYYLTMNVPTEVYDSDDPTMYPMYLRWDRYDEDTIKVKVQKIGNAYISVSKIWFNGKDVWDFYRNEGGRTISIIK